MFTGCRNFSMQKPKGRPPKLTPDVLRRIREATRAEPTITIRQLARQFDLGTATIHKALRSVLKLCKCLCILRPHDLNAVHRRKRLQASRQILGRMRRSPRWCSKVITADESWMHVYNLTRRQQSATWLESGEARHSKLRCEMSTKKVMLIAFWDTRSIVHREFVPDGRAINAQVYRSILRRMKESVRRRHRELWRNRHHQFWLQHDNAAPHHTRIMRCFCDLTDTKIISHPPYSPDLAPSDFFLFACIKKELRGVRFANVDALKQAVDIVIRNIPQFEFAHAMEQSW